MEINPVRTRPGRSFHRRQLNNFGFMVDHVARDTKRPKLAEPEDDKGPTVADLAAYLVSRGGNAAQADGWSVGKNPRGDTIFTDPNSGRVFRSKPEVARFLNVGQA